MITWKTLEGVNTAGLLDTRTDIMSVIDCAMEALKDDLIPAILSEDFEFMKFKISYEIVNDTITFAWNWESRELHNQQQFRFSPITETAEAFISKIKGYFFDLSVMIANI